MDTAMDTISYDDYLRLLGLKTLADDHNRSLVALRKSAWAITRETEDGEPTLWGHTNDLIFDNNTSVDDALDKMGLTVERVPAAPPADEMSLTVDWTASEAEWDAAKAHFDGVRRIYEDLEGQPGRNTSLALRTVFYPLACRYASGERSQALYDEMMRVKD